MFKTWRDQSFCGFLKKKLIRIWPLHLIMFSIRFAGALLSHSFNFTPTQLITALIHVFLLQTWVPNVDIVTSFNTVSWFLSSLLFCYIVGYFLMKWFRSGKYGATQTTYGLTILLLTAKIIAAIVFPTGNGWGYYLAYLCPLAVLPDFLLGFLLAINAEKINLSEKGRTGLQLAALVLIGVMFATKHFIPGNFSRGFYTIPFTFLLVFSITTETGISKTVFGNRFAVFLGDLSFEIYLIHNVLIKALCNRLDIVRVLVEKHLAIVPVIVFTCLSVMCAVIYKKLFETICSAIKKWRER
jgi:peptidoglycan/LPS O-acetylase OafA/YrhL